MSVCRFVKSMPRRRSRVRLIVRQAILPCPSVRPTTLIRSIGLVFNVARQIHVRTMLRPAHYHILTISTQGLCLRLRDDISLPYCTARKSRCFMNYRRRRWGRRTCCRPQLNRSKEIRRNSRSSSCRTFTLLSANRNNRRNNLELTEFSERPKSAAGRQRDDSRS